jgi:hypothetical protein
MSDYSMATEWSPAAEGAAPTVIAGAGDTRAPLVLRVLAYIADLCVVSVPVALALIVNVVFGLEQGYLLLGIGLLVALIGSIVLHGATGASPGKHLAQIRVVRNGTAVHPGYGPSAIRSVIFAVLAPIAALPAWTVLADSRRRGIHEKASGTAVVDAQALPAPAPVAAPDNVDPFAAADGPTAVAPGPAAAFDSAPGFAGTDERTEFVQIRERIAPPVIPTVPGSSVPPRFGPPPIDDGAAVARAVAVPLVETPQAPVAPVPQNPPPQQAQQPGAPVEPPRAPQPQGTRPTQPAPRPTQSVPRPSQPAPSGGQRGGPLRQATPRSTGPIPDRTAPQPQAGQPAPSGGKGGFKAGPTVVLRFDDGHSLDVSGEGIIGREPIVPTGVDRASYLRHVLVDDTASVSKTHLRFGITRGELWVEDVGSTNGSAIAYHDSWTELKPHTRYAVERGSVVHIGQRSFRVLAG